MPVAFVGDLNSLLWNFIQPLFFTFQTTQGNRLSCRDQEGRRGSEEAVPGPSVFPSREPGVSGDFCSVHGILQAKVLEWGAIAFSA